MKLKERKKLKKNILRVLKKHGCIDPNQVKEQHTQTIYAQQNLLMHDIEALFSGDDQRHIREARDYGGSISLDLRDDELIATIHISSKKKRYIRIDFPVTAPLASATS